MLDKITPLILTLNEAPNLDRTLQCLTWATQIIIIDSYSTDATLDIAHTYPQVQIFQRSFDSYAHQWNFAVQKVSSEWVLTLDADYILSKDLIQELNSLSSDSLINCYLAPFKYCVFGKALKGTLLPPREVLFRREKAIHHDDGHRQLLKVQGERKLLSSYIYHDDRKSLSRWLWAQDRYMILEVNKLRNTPFEQLSWGDRLRKLKIVAPPIILFYCLILKGGILDGWAGWYYAFQRLLAEILLSIRLIEAETMTECQKEMPFEPSHEQWCQEK